MEPLTPAQVQELEKAIKDLGIDPKDVTIRPNAEASVYIFDHIRLGKNAFPAPGQGNTGTAFETMTLRAVVAHEAGHLITTRAGTDFEGRSLMGVWQS